jgi:hypothetical protein
MGGGVSAHEWAQRKETTPGSRFERYVGNPFCVRCGKAMPEKSDDDPCPGTRSAPRGLVLAAVERMTAELTTYLHADDALCRARTIAQILQDGTEDPVRAVCEALDGHLDDHGFHERVLAVQRTAAAWVRETGAGS